MLSNLLRLKRQGTQNFLHRNLSYVLFHCYYFDRSEGISFFSRPQVNFINCYSFFFFFPIFCFFQILSRFDHTQTNVCNVENRCDRHYINHYYTRLTFFFDAPTFSLSLSFLLLRVLYRARPRSRYTI